MHLGELALVERREPVLALPVEEVLRDDLPTLLVESEPVGELAVDNLGDARIDRGQLPVALQNERRGVGLRLRDGGRLPLPVDRRLGDGAEEVLDPTVRVALEIAQLLLGFTLLPFVLAGFVLTGQLCRLLLLPLFGQLARSLEGVEGGGGLSGFDRRTGHGCSFRKQSE